MEEAFWHWRTLAHGPLRHLLDQMEDSGCSVRACGCYGVDFRGHLAVVLRALPPRSARELRALVLPLDAKILARAKVVPAHSLDAAWWTGRF
ncbi:hypothetical protein ACGFS9_01835 [Streptomyces sp. NPDC048566]|uniref:hypothetical protein n=1 Tax=Streptomyces sp. NPDC048566 TaxID=3365569 RepID=UPI0037111649